MSRLLTMPLIALGFVVACQLARLGQPHTRFVFLMPQVCFRPLRVQTSPRDDTLAFR
jgi:hypothetical protein